MELKWAARTEADTKAKELAIKKTYEFAQFQREQHDKKLEQVKQNQEQKLLEGQQIRQLDFEYNSKQSERDEKRRQAQKDIMAELLEKHEQSKIHKAKMALEEQVQDEKIDEWIAHKDKLEVLRKEAEQRLFQYARSCGINFHNSFFFFREHLKVREKIGLEQYAKLSEERNKKNAWVDMRMKQKQKEEQQKEEKLQQRRAQATADMQKFFKEMQAHKEELLQQKLELNRKVAEDNARVSMEILNEANNKREKIRQKELEIYESHRQQIERARDQRDKAKEQIHAEKEKMAQDEKTELDVLRRYTSTLLEQPWVKSNPRIHSVDHYMHAVNEKKVFASASTRSAVKKTVKPKRPSSRTPQSSKPSSQ